MSPPMLDEGASWQTTDATALFLAALARITPQLSEPDPADKGAASKSARGLHVHWDFDYYRWDLWLAERSSGHALVFLERN